MLELCRLSLFLYRYMVFGTDGIRGLVNKYPMIPEILTRIGMLLPKIICPEIKSPKVLIAKDTRLSGYMIEPALVSGLISAGVDVTLVGPMPTNAASMLIPSLRCDFGIMITASHNPYYDNGLKIFYHDGYKISNETEEMIHAALIALEIAGAPNCTKYREYLSSTTGKAARLKDAHGRYIEHVKGSFPKNYNLNNIRIVVDCANGAAYKIAPMILWELGANVINIGCEPNGTNINENCGSIHPQAMADKVIETRADIGVAFDGDGDRITVCDENGCIIDSNHIIGFLTRYIADKGELNESAIVTTELANTGLIQYMNSMNIDVFSTKVGDKYIIEKMREKNIIFGGEPSGHMIFKNYTNNSDGIIAALQILSAILYFSCKTSEISTAFKLFPSTLLSIPAGSSAMNEEIIGNVQKLCDKFPNNRIIIRKSGTENVIRILIESRTNEELDIVIEEVMAKINSTSHI